MEINLHNYEAFFLDHKEGNLSPELQKELFLFLEKHPHLYEELAAFENVTLDDFSPAEIFPGKEFVKKTEFTSEDIIAYTEGIADARTKREIETLSSQNRELRKEIALYGACVVEPDLGIKFKNKEVLKKRGVVIALRTNYTFLRVAAAVLLLAGLFFLISNLASSEVKDQKIVADRDQSAVSSRQLAVNSQSAVGSQQLAVKNSQSAVSSLHSEQPGKKEEHKYSVKEKSSDETKNVAVNNVQAPAVILNNNLKEEPVVANENISKKDAEENPATIKSYYNYHPDTDEDELPAVTASAAPVKRSFFRKLVNVAKNINQFGLKNVNASEQGNLNTVSVGSLVVTETTSN